MPFWQVGDFVSSATEALMPFGVTKLAKGSPTIDPSLKTSHEKREHCDSVKTLPRESSETRPQHRACSVRAVRQPVRSQCGCFTHCALSGVCCRRG